MRDLVLTLVDALALIVVAAGCGLTVAGCFLLAWHCAGPVVIAVGLGAVAGGLVLAVTSWLASRRVEVSSEVPS